MKLQPLYDRVLIEIHTREAVSDHGILLPEPPKEIFKMGRVIAAGWGKTKDTPLAVKVGDMVACGLYAGVQVGDDRFLVREDEILAVIEDDNTKQKGS